MPRFTANLDALYFTDNGAMLCGSHLGMTARYSGRDISGQPIELVTPEAVRELDAVGCPAKCERCGKVASLLVTL